LLPPRQRDEHRTAGQIEELASIVSVIMLITCSCAKPPCSDWPANRQTGAEMIAL
jgi:hypothetical protein